MRSTLRKAAIEQANLLVAYLSQTPSAGLDIEFVQTHLDALREYASAAASGPWREVPNVSSNRSTAH